ncbi:cyclin-F2-2-like [Brachypodium distachyon]|uniref:cyclin-F2-2-like n=1 Tax=Brachypodium distachyon TaxID=15368 RepID=UPI0001C7487D|nr:cyclin-F2-2-like [Brachypodium distachyon]|eukprot:XP_024317236.1 cyclin-F2-2-like [Brachypodium distachyon]
MAFMDPFAFDLPSRPRVPSFFRRFSGCSAHAHVVQPAVEVPVPLLERAVPFFHDDSLSKSSKARPRLCPDYDADIDANLKMMEKNAGERPSPGYLTTVQGDRISPVTRGALVLWMDKFVRHYELGPGTLHLAVACIDRVLSVRTARSYGAYELQLLGATAFFAAAKYEDQSTKYKLNTAEIARYCGLETSEEARETEREMMKALGFQISRGPTAHTFVGHFTRFSQGREELRVQRLAHRIADQSLLSHVCVGFLPSVVAAWAIFLARFALNPADVLAWNAEMQELTGYGSLDLSGCVQIMYSFSQSLICNPPF